MPRIPALTNDQADPAARDILVATQAKIGMVPNTFRTIAHAPSALAGFTALQGAVHAGVLSAAERETIALATAQYNACGYCVSAHSLLGKHAKLSADDMAAARRGEGGPYARLAHRIVETRGQVSDADLAEARAAGLDDRRIIETVVAVAESVLTNFVNNVADVEIDFPKVAL